MATMDTINHFGGNPFFLERGAALQRKKLLKHSKSSWVTMLKGIFVNIFGGIMKCDVILEGIVATVKVNALPLVVRLEGTNVERGKEILNESGLAIEPATMVRRSKLLSLLKKRKERMGTLR